MKTEEGELKKYVNDELLKFGCYSFMPVQTGYGKRTIDFLVCIPIMHNHGRIGRFLGIETKRKGKEPTKLQEDCMKEIIAAGGAAFWCDSRESFLMAMEMWGLLPR